MSDAARQSTSQTYSALTYAYDYFNERLFDSALPGAMLTLQRKKKTYGYFCSQRFGTRKQDKADEIAMNPNYFGLRPIPDTLSTLVHEMVHQWQAHHGRPGRRAYHNREWARKMLAVGLRPTVTGRPGAPMTGEKVTHLIVHEGRFDQLCEALITTDFRMEWYDRFPDQRVDPDLVNTLHKFRPDDPAKPEGEGALLSVDYAATDRGPVVVEDLPPPPGNAESLDDIVQRIKRAKVKYRCPQCKINAWAKYGVSLICGQCQNPLTPQFTIDEQKAMDQFHADQQAPTPHNAGTPEASITRP
ncbi:SprT-like domain-containing protein [Salinisphaera sp. P385]|uniref:SprT-like domain-containing protein n=1 Tax=Spectribacter acetivorans TaxID=3075603 RepID=A0ABU3B7N3_9GAMM|nr:SprT-like domain-containing protein [Salinisphaera sp. P385]MDT0618477.1 SprT-like domain-containing protein [Salinisphaera sp. P385]